MPLGRRRAYEEQLPWLRAIDRCDAIEAAQVGDMKPESRAALNAELRRILDDRSQRERIEAGWSAMRSELGGRKCR
jgi:hypothetical protein